MGTRVENAATTRPREEAPSTPPRGSLRVPDRLFSALLAAVLLAAAELAARGELVSELILPAPSAVLNALVDGFAGGTYWRHIWSTVSATGLGFALAATTAILLAGALASVPFLERVLLPFVVAFQTLPKIAVAPLIVLWLGFGSLGKTFVVTVVCFFPILVNALQGLKIRDRNQYELMRSLGASRWQMFRYLRMPNALPYIFAGLHIGVIFSLIGAVVSEFVGSRSGLGYILLSDKAQFNVPGVYAILTLLMVLGLGLHWIMKVAERRVAFWAQEVTVVGT